MIKLLIELDKCVQKSPENTINNTETTCGREKKIIYHINIELKNNYNASSKTL
jgi:hypothetical protein